MDGCAGKAPVRELETKEHETVAGAGGASNATRVSDPLFC
jgi:hypothetical protein